jgi:hypothetical protein
VFHEVVWAPHFMGNPQYKFKSVLLRRNQIGAERSRRTSIHGTV